MTPPVTPAGPGEHRPGTSDRVSGRDVRTGTTERKGGTA